jgi:hypothetical protein
MNPHVVGRRKTLTVAAGVAAASLLLSGCEIFGPTGPSYDRTSIGVSLRNLSDAPVHMFISGETFPCCQVGSGDTRSVTVSVPDSDPKASFRVGRNGSVFSEITCQAKPGGSGRAVTFSGAGLACVSW